VREGPDYQHDHTKQWSEKIASFDGFVIVTPEYNHVNAWSSALAPLRTAASAA
jgi:NADPH-dependent FMN reductase